MVILGAALLVRCADSPSGPIVDGVDLGVLFAPARAAEIAAIRSEWATRNPVARDVEVVRARAFPLGGTPGTLRVLSHVVDGNRHYGAIIAPDAGGPRPVLMLLHGGDEGVDVTGSDVQEIILALGDLADDFVYAIPSFRSEDLSADGITYHSEGAPSPWDRDVDDAMAFLDATLGSTPVADPERVALIGFSRGGLVALLMGIRDPRVDRIVEFMGPTDFFDDYVYDLVVDALDGDLRDLPGFEALNQRFIQPLRDGTLTEEQLRPELVRRSAVLFARDLPTLQLHHGTADEVVAVSQAESLIETMERLSRGPPEFQGFLYEGGEHDPLTLTGSLPRVGAFILGAW